MKTVKEITVSSDLIDYIQKLYYEYTTRKDVINSLFDIHKYDEDASVINSVAFKHYEKLFMESKIAYDQAMEEIQKNFIPEEYQSDKYRFEVAFAESIIKIAHNE